MVGNESKATHGLWLCPRPVRLWSSELEIESSRFARVCLPCSRSNLVPHDKSFAFPRPRHHQHTVMSQSTQPVKLNDEQIDDLLYCARAGELEDLGAYLDELVPPSTQEAVKAKQAVLAQVVDGSGNGMFHYVCANGHLGECDDFVKSISTC